MVASRYIVITGRRLTRQIASTMDGPPETDRAASRLMAGRMYSTCVAQDTSLHLPPTTELLPLSQIDFAVRLRADGHAATLTRALRDSRLKTAGAPMSREFHAVASPGSEGRGARVGGLEISPQRDAEPPLPRLGVSNTGVNGKLLHTECLSPFPSTHLSLIPIPFPFLPSLPFTSRSPHCS